MTGELGGTTWCDWGAGCDRGRLRLTDLYTYIPMKKKENSKFLCIFDPFFNQFPTILGSWGLPGTTLQKGTKKDAKKVPKYNLDQTLLETVFGQFRVFWESIF